MQKETSYRIDAHQHFWYYHPIKDAWINDSMRILQNDFLPENIASILAENNIAGCIAVQADQSIAETNFLLSLAEKYSFIKGVVGWIDLCANDIALQLQLLQPYKKLKGFRHILQAEEDRKFMLRDSFKRGLAALQEYDYTFDILVLPDQLPYVLELVTAFPQQRFIIDHLAKPEIKNKKLQPWEEYMRAIALNQNVYCKLSGLFTEAVWHKWHFEDFYPFLFVVDDAFGAHRLLFGSDWPVCLLSSVYADGLHLLDQFFQHYTAAEKQCLFGNNAVHFYRLNY